jgi:hypothetical protein
MFNLNKIASQPSQSPISKKLEKQRAEFGFKEPETATELQLKDSVRKDEDSSVHFEKRLEDARSSSPNTITEGSLCNGDKLFNNKRDSLVSNLPANPTNLLAEANFQKQLDEFRKANKTDDSTNFWDSQVGITKKDQTVTWNKNPNSQLQNHYNRFEGLKPNLKQEIKDMVIASLSDADALLFQIYAFAASERRDLNAKEQQQVIDINSGKARLLLAQGLPAVDDNMELNSDFDDWQTDEASSLSVEQNSNGSFDVKENGHIIDNFPTYDQAIANYPELSLENDNDNTL